MKEKVVANSTGLIKLSNLSGFQIHKMALRPPKNLRIWCKVASLEGARYSRGIGNKRKKDGQSRYSRGLPLDNKREKERRQSIHHIFSKSKSAAMGKLHKPVCKNCYTNQGIFAQQTTLNGETVNATANAHHGRS